MELDIVNLLFVLLLAWVCGVLLARFGLPALLGELAAGIIFGPPVLGLLQTGPGLEILADLGVFLLLLYIGMEINYRELLRASATGLLTAAGGFLVPCILGYLYLTHQGHGAMAGLVLGLTMGITSLAVLSRVLVDLDLLGTRVANVMVAGAVISDTAGLVVFGLMLSMADEPAIRPGMVALALGKALVFFGLTILVGIKVFPTVGALLKKWGFKERTANFTILLLVGFIFAELAELANLHHILGAFLAGLFMRGEVLMRKISHDVTRLVHDLSIGFLAPIFFVLAGFHVNLYVLVDHWDVLIAVIILGTVGKVLGTTLFHLPSGNGWREALTIGVGMNAHGAVEIIIAEIAYEMGLIGHEVFSVIVFMALITTAAVPVMLKAGVGMLRKRNELARADENRKGILIAGATPLARKLAKELAGQESVTLVDTNENRCRAARAEELTVQHGNVLREDTLEALNAANARAFIAMTPNPEVNHLALRRIHEQFGVPDLFVVPIERPIDEDGDGPETTQALGGRLLFGKGFKQDLWDGMIIRQEAERVTYPIEQEYDRATLDTRLDHLGILPLVLIRDRKRMLLPAVEGLKPGDEIIGLRRKEEAKTKEDQFDTLVRSCPILDVKKALAVEEFFAEVAGILADKLNLETAALYELLMRREMESTTVLVPGLAIPHIMLEGGKDFAMVLARCRDGISFFESETEARIVFVLAGPAKDRNTHLRLLSAIAQLFQDPSFEDSLMAVEDEAKMREVILSTERRRF